MFWIKANANNLTTSSDDTTNYFEDVQHKENNVGEYQLLPRLLNLRNFCLVVEFGGKYPRAMDGLFELHVDNIRPPRNPN